MNEIFRKFAHRVSSWMGSPYVFVSAVVVVILWASMGPTFHYSDTWQLIINTSTTIVTFLMVFVIQNTQNRDGKGVQLKLDELIRANKHARNMMIDLENMSDQQLEALQADFCSLKEETDDKLEAIEETKEKRGITKRKR